MEYHFAENRISTGQQILIKGKETVSLGTKITICCSFFVENAGQILIKDQIIESVWAGQIVTDAALAKQILRLRKILDDQSQAYIVRARFLAG